jgi:hypothetical protein
MKLLSAIAGVALLAVAGVAGALVIARQGGEDGSSPTKPSPTVDLCDARAVPPDQQLWRWMDLVVLLPKVGFAAHPGYIPPEPTRPNGGEGLVTYKFDPSDPSNPNVGASVLIDAETGAIVHSGGPEHGKVMGIALCPFDPATAPWPYNGDPPEPLTNMEPSIRADPGSGIYVSFVTGDGGYSGVTPTPADCDFALSGIEAQNGRSSAFIGKDQRTGSICKNLSNVRPEDLVAFQRFLDRVELCVYQEAAC